MSLEPCLSTFVSIYKNNQPMLYCSSVKYININKASLKVLCLFDGDFTFPVSMKDKYKQKVKINLFVPFKKKYYIV